MSWEDPDDSTIDKYQIFQFPESVIKLISNDHDGGDELGWSVAVDGDTLVIGALGDDDGTILNVGAAYVFTRVAGGWTQAGKLTARVRKNDAGFGYAVAVHGDTIVVGAYEEDHPDNINPLVDIADVGAAYVFTKPANGWANMTETARLTASDAAANDEFGTSVAVHKDTIVVGAPEEDTGARGSAYIFTKPANGWADMPETAALRGQSNGDRLGRSVAVHGDTVVVGAFEENGAGGAAHVFTEPGGGWASTSTAAKLTASDRASYDKFGRAVAMDGDTIVIGAPYHDYDDPDNNTNDVSDSGSAYVFIKPATGGWATDTETAKLIASERAANDQFGFSVAVDGNTVVVGADQDDSYRGSVYVFTKPQGGWTDTEGTDPLTAYDRSQDDRFGNFVAVDGDTVLVGAVGDNSDKGSAYVFGGEWADIPGSGAGTDSHIARGLRNNVKHTFRVRAVNAAGEGDPTDEESATPVAATSAPAAPANFSATQTGAGQVELTWDAHRYPLTVAGYSFYQSPGVTGDGWTDVDGSDSSTVSHTVTNLNTGDYTFAVRAVNGAGESGPPNPWSVTIVATPQRPTGLGTTSGDTQATFHWNVTVETTDRPIDKHQLLQLAQSKLTADDRANDDEFGYSVAIDRNTAVVGAPGSNSNAGAVYVFVFTEADGAWGQAAKLSVPVTGDKFGISVAIDGDTIVVGAHQNDADENDNDEGAAYVFTRVSGMWGQKAKLTAFDAAANDEFGISVAVHGETVVVGAHLENANDDDQDGTNDVSDSGAAYVFTKPGSGGWADATEKAKLTASDGAPNDKFGYSVAIDGNTAVVGAHQPEYQDENDVTVEVGPGAAYVFTKPTGGWTDNTKGAKFTAPDGAANDEFGVSVAIDVDAVLVGAHLHDVGANANAGAAYVFTRDSNSGKWAQPLKLTASNGHADDGFGNSVAVDGNTAVVGAYLDDRDNAARDTGSTYVFARKLGVWSQTLNLAGPGPDQNDRLGYSVAVDDGTLLAGAPQDDNSPGFAYAMDISDAEWADFVPTGIDDDGKNFYRVLNLTNDQEYAFRVRSVNAAANRPSAETVAATPMLAKPGRTEGLSAKAGNRRVTLSWDDPRDSSLTGYQVLRTPEHTKLTAGSDGAANEKFGGSVAVDDGTAVVGAPEHDGTDSGGDAITDAGAGYVFTRNPNSGAWSDPIELTAGSDGAENDWFGYSVAVESNVAVIGAYQHDTNDNADAGAAYVFTRDPLTGVWSEPVKLIANDGAENDWFGYSVAVDGETIVVGARWHNGKAGAAYVFTRNSGTGVWGDDPVVSGTQRIQTAKLTATGGAGFDYFGHSVAVDGETIVIGAPGYNDKTGVAYVFTRDSGTGVWGNDPEPGETHRVETAKLTAFNGHVGDGFGNSVAVNGETIVVGAQQGDGERGAAYVFTEPTDDGGWADNTETAKLAASDRELGDHFGNSVAVRGGSIVVGAYTANINECDECDEDPRSGAAYVFTRPANVDWANDPNKDYRTESGKLTLPTEEGTVEKYDEFGNSVALDGQSIVVGVPEGNDGFGSVYVSDIPQWAFLASGAETTSATVRGLTNGVEYAFQVRAFDFYGEGLPSDIARAAPDAPPNRSPYFIIGSDSATFTIDENPSPGTPVGSALTATDPNGDRLSYSLSGTDAYYFGIDSSTGQLIVKEPLDFETQSVYEVTVRVSDARNASDDVDVTIFVNNVDEAGTVAVSLEQPKVGTALVVSLSDPDGLVSDISWQWAASSDGSSWSDISGANSSVYTPVADDAGSYFRATASYVDRFGSGKSAHVVTRLPTAQRGPSFEGDVTLTVDENTPPGSLVGDAITATDPEGDILTYSLWGTDASFVVRDGSTGQITVGSGSMLDYESGPTRYTVVVSVHDGRDVYGNDDASVDDSIEVNIDVSNVDEAGTVAVSPEQPQVGTALVVSLSDPDVSLSDISWQWAASSDGSDWSDVSGANSDSYVPVAVDVGSYLRATASYRDGHGPGKTAHAVMESQTAQRAPSFDGDVTLSVDENTPPGGLVGDAITATDPDGDVLTYSMWGNDAAFFVIDGATGQITVGSGTLLDYETGPTRYAVIVSVHDGGDAYGKDDTEVDDRIEVNIDVSNVDEAGTVTVSLEQPEVGIALVVSLSDPEGSLSDISWQWERSSDRTGWQDIAGASFSNYTPVDLDADKYLRVTVTYADGEGSGKQAQAVLNNPVQRLPEPVARPTVVPEPVARPTVVPSPTPAPIVPVDDGGISLWWIILMAAGAVAGAAVIYIIVRKRGPI